MDLYIKMKPAIDGIAKFFGKIRMVVVLMAAIAGLDYLWQVFSESLERIVWSIC